MKKKLLMIITCLCLLFALTACGSGSSSESSESSGGSQEGISKGDLNIEDFDWTVEEAKIQGYDCYALSLANNSKYDLLGVQIEYAPKADVTEEQLAIFDSFVKENADYIDEGQGVEDVILRGDRVQYVASGDSVENIPLAIGINDFTWTDIPNEEQFNLMEPRELMVAVIGSDDILYFAYCDLTDNSWKIDSETAKLNEWPDIEIANLIPKPEGYVFKSDDYDNINALDIDVYGVSEEEFSAYVDQVKELSFSSDTLEYDDYYSAEDKDGNSITLDYDDTTSSFNISAYGK